MSTNRTTFIEREGERENNHGVYDFISDLLECDENENEKIRNPYGYVKRHVDTCVRYTERRIMERTKNGRVRRERVITNGRFSLV